MLWSNNQSMVCFSILVKSLIEDQHWSLVICPAGVCPFVCPQHYCNLLFQFPKALFQNLVNFPLGSKITANINQFFIDGYVFHILCKQMLAKFSSCTLDERNYYLNSVMLNVIIVIVWLVVKFLCIKIIYSSQAVSENLFLTTPTVVKKWAQSVV